MTSESSLNSKTKFTNKPVTSQAIEQLYPPLRVYAQEILEAMNAYMPMKVTDTMRSMQAQLILYQKGRKLVNGRWQIVVPGEIVTNARPGMSYHCYGLAFDCAFSGSDPYLTMESPKERMRLWNQYGLVVKQMGLTWGGDFTLRNGAHDLPHAEMTYGLSIVDCLELFEREGLKGIWTHLDRMRNVPVGTEWS